MRDPAPIFVASFDLAAWVLDQFVKRDLKISGYMRYMDDLVLFHDDKERLAEAMVAIAEWLLQERGLTLNPRYKEIMPTRHPAVFLGYRISRAGITPSRRLRRRMLARLGAAARQGPEALTRCLASYRGLVTF